MLSAHTPQKTNEGCEQSKHASKLNIENIANSVSRLGLCPRMAAAANALSTGGSRANLSSVEILHDRKELTAGVQELCMALPGSWRRCVAML